MKFLKSIFKDDKIENNNDFWIWFVKNEKTFFNSIKSNDDIHSKFLNKLGEKLNFIKDDIYFLTGMLNNHMAEIIFTADGNLKTIPFVEQLVNDAPKKLSNWKFTALKQPSVEEFDFEISYMEKSFSCNNIFFYDTIDKNYPDEIILTFVYKDDKTLTDEVKNGIYIFVDNYIGELQFINQIDQIDFATIDDAKKELIPIHKIKSYLIWREKEFIEKYENVSYDKSTEEFSLLETTLKNENKLISTINTGVLNWKYKASHPWMANIYIQFDGENYNGMPSTKDTEILNQIEESLLLTLNESEEYIYIGRLTGDNYREIYFTGKDFRKASMAFYHIKEKYTNKYVIDYDLYLDRYWKSHRRFINE